jgi:hypothetical protein
MDESLCRGSEGETGGSKTTEASSARLEEFSRIRMNNSQPAPIASAPITIINIRFFIRLILFFSPDAGSLCGFYLARFIEANSRKLQH